jgi:hypothetical protein
MNDQDLMTAVKDSFAGVRMHTPTATVLARGQALRTRRRVRAAAGVLTTAAAGAALAVAVLAPAGVPRAAKATPGTDSPPSAAPALAAWTVTERPDGTVKVTIRQMRDPAGLQAKLRANGVRVVVTVSLRPPAACQEWRAGHYRMSSDLVRMKNRTGLPSRNGSEFFLRPSAIPAGALLWLAVLQAGKPAGVTGPPGPMGFGFFRATQACTES